MPNADIHETPDGINVVLEMPGVDRNRLDIKLEEGLLRVEGSIDFSKYQGLVPIYTEYNVGNYARSFRLSNEIDQDKISAELSDGVLTIVLPKAEKAKPRTIQIR